VPYDQKREDRGDRVPPAQRTLPTQGPAAQRIPGSESIAKLTTALRAARKSFGKIKKDHKNTFQGNSYATLGGVLAAVDDALADNGLIAFHSTRWDAGELWLDTTIEHESGEWIASVYPLFAANYFDPQKIGSSLTYARRYVLQAMLGVASEDDDGVSAVDRGQSHQQQGRGEDRRQQRRDDRPRQHQASREEVNQQFPAASGGPLRETWSQWIGPVVTRSNKDWREEMFREGVEDRYQREYKDLTMEPREVQYLCSLMVEAGKLSEEAVAKDNKPGVRDPAKCRAVVAERFDRHPERIKSAVMEHLRHKRIELRAKLGMPDFEGDDDDDSPPGVGGYEGTEIAAGTPPPLTDLEESLSN
jgi:hypothetical protein